MDRATEVSCHYALSQKIKKRVSSSRKPGTSFGKKGNPFGRPGKPFGKLGTPFGYDKSSL